MTVWQQRHNMWAICTLTPSTKSLVESKIGNRLVKDGFTPRTWHAHPLHLCPPEPYDPAHPGTRATLDWIFLISSLNFSFWSYLDGSDDCFGVEWREGWESSDRRRVVHTGYWSLVAALDRGELLTPQLRHVDFDFEAGQ
jgi:hypothetical protein